MKTTLQQIRDCGPCQDGWEKLLRSLDKTKADDKNLCLLTILESNGLDDSLWCLQSVTGHDREKRLFAVWCASEVKNLLTSPQSLNALVVAEDFAEGRATHEELAAARAAARAAAWAAACDAASDAARAAAWAAAWAAASDDACDVARAAARAAASDAARAAARAAASDDACDVARAAARAAARDAQKTEFIRMINCINTGERYDINTK